MTTEYAKAYKAANQASAQFGKAQMAYRSGKIGDAEFLAARDKFKAAQAAFDVAFAKESELPEVEA